MGADGASNGINGHWFALALVKLGAVLYVFLQHRIGKTAVGHGKGPVKPDAPGLFNHFPQQIVGLFRSPCLAHYDHFPIFNRQHRLDGQHAAHHRRSPGKSAALFEIFQSIHQRHDPDMLFFLHSGYLQFPQRAIPAQ